MKLIIKEYLNLLKESKELDVLLPNLLLMMGLEPIVLPQVGVRQYGVDVAAVGKYESESDVLFIFTIKEGDLGRSDWSSNEQSVRQSLEEIKDVYLESHIPPKYKSFKKIVILCTGGLLKQEIQQNWNGYVNRNTVTGKIEYDFWGGDKLTLLIEKYMLNSQALPPACQSSFRKILVLMNLPDYDYSDFVELLSKLLFDSNLNDFSKPSVKKRTKKTFKIIDLMLRIIFYWGQNENNLKPAYIITEKALLTTWDFLRNNELTEKKSFIKMWIDIYNTFFEISSEYFQKIQKYCHVQNGLYGYSQEPVIESINVFEQFGIMSTIGLLNLFQGFSEKQEVYLNNAKVAADTIKALISNHESLYSPFFDGNIIEISEAIILLYSFKENDFLNSWLNKTIHNIAFAYNHMEAYFPVQSDSFDDAVTLSLSKTVTKDEMMKISTLLPIIAQWCSLLNLQDTYSLIIDVMGKIFSDTTLQIWYPDENTEQFIYRNNAALKSGKVDAPIKLPPNIDEMKTMIRQVKKHTINPYEKLTSLRNGLQILPIISSRHYRTPVLPIFWQILIDQPAEN